MTKVLYTGETKKCSTCGCELKDENSRNVGQCLPCFAMEQSDFEDEEEDTGPDYWECLSCGHSQTHRGMGGQCPKCCYRMEEGYY